MIYLEHSARNKCVQITTDGTQVVIVRGAVGTPFESRVHNFDTEAEANRWVSVRVSSLDRRGYRSDRQNQQLIDDIAKHVNSDGSRLVYGDWLEELHQPRGELIALQAAKRRGAAVESDHEAELLKKKEQLLLGDWALYSQIDWYLGFAKSITYEQDQYLDWRVRDDFRVRALLGRVRRLLSHPTNRFLEAFTLRLGELSSYEEWLLTITLPIRVASSLRARGGFPGPILRVVVEAYVKLRFSSAANHGRFTIDARIIE